MQSLHDDDEGGEGVVYFHKRERSFRCAEEFRHAGGQGGRGDNCRGPAGLEKAGVALVLHEGQILGTGFRHRFGGADDSSAVAMHLPVHQHRQVVNGDLHEGSGLSSLKGASAPPRGRAAIIGIIVRRRGRNNPNFPNNRPAIQPERRAGG